MLKGAFFLIFFLLLAKEDAHERGRPQVVYYSFTVWRTRWVVLLRPGAIQKKPMCCVIF